MDTFSPEKRSEIMRCVKSTNTTPEMEVRSLLHGLGYRFRLHRKDLPGMPDIVLPKHHTSIFVHGCFWHRHTGCPAATTPTSRQEYWLPKFSRTIERDKKNQAELHRQGWQVIIVWECETKDLVKLARRITDIFCGEPIARQLPEMSIDMVAEQNSEYSAIKGQKGSDKGEKERRRRPGRFPFRT